MKFPASNSKAISWLTCLVVSLAAALAQANPIDPTDSRRLQVSSVTLVSDADLDAGIRAAAAAELLDLNLTEAREILVTALVSQRPEVIRAICEALLAAPQPDPALLPTVLEILPGADPQLRPTLASLLARYGRQDAGAIEAVAAIAHDQSRPESERIAAVEVLGDFRHAPAAAAAELMAILEHAQDTPGEVVRAATGQLSRLTGLPPSNNVHVWIRWWTANRDRPAELWLRDMVHAVSQQAADLQQELEDSMAMQDLMTRRLMTAYGDLWPVLAIEQQQAKIVQLLSDDLGPIRRFGVERLAVLLRDGNDTPEGRTAVLALLIDEDVTVRRAVANLLIELDQEAVHEAILTRMPGEQDAQVLNAMLARVAATGTSDLPPTVVRPLLERAEVRHSAIRALLTLLATDESRTPEVLEALLPTVRTIWDLDPTPDGAALLILTGTAEDVSRVEPRLDSADETWRSRVAQALVRRGVLDAVLARSDDPVIYPHALVAASTGAGIGRLDRVLGLTPPETLKDRWTEAVVAAAQTVPAVERIRADALLAQQPGISPATRAALLQDAVNAQDLDEQMRVDLVTRLGPLALETGDPRALVALIDSLPDNRVTEELAHMKFDAAIRGRLFEEAAQVHDDPESWVHAFEVLLEAEPDAADLVRTEIVRRFNGQLDEPLRTRLGLASDPLMDDADEQTPS